MVVTDGDPTLSKALLQYFHLAFHGIDRNHIEKNIERSIKQAQQKTQLGPSDKKCIFFKESKRDFAAWMLKKDARAQSGIATVTLAGAATKTPNKPANMQKRQIQPHFIWLRENRTVVAAAFGWKDVTRQEELDKLVLIFEIPEKIRLHSAKLLKELKNDAY